MRINQKHLLFTGITYSVLFLLAAGTVSAQESPINLEQRIEFIKELVFDMQDAQWTDSMGELVQGIDVAPRGVIARGMKKGRIQKAPGSSVTGDMATQEPVNITVIDVKLNPTQGRERIVRGTYEVNLPRELKLIQLEVNYDVLLENPEIPSEAEFFVEVYEQDQQNPGQWRKTGEVKQNVQNKFAESRRILEVLDEESGERKETYVSHSYNANLSSWAGKKVRIALAATAPSNSERAQQGRWLQARLVGATFDYQIAVQ